MPNPRLDGRLVLLTSFTDPTSAHFATTLLENAGIESVLADENTVTVNFLYSNAIGGVRVMVFEEDLERAAEVLEAMNEADDSADDQLEEEVEAEPQGKSSSGSHGQCPNCGSDEINVEPFSKAGLALSTLVLGIPLPILKPKGHCFSCGHEWRAKDRPAINHPIPATLIGLYSALLLGLILYLSYNIHFIDQLVRIEATRVNSVKVQTAPDWFVDRYIAETGQPPKITRRLDYRFMWEDEQKGFMWYETSGNGYVINWPQPDNNPSFLFGGGLGESTPKAKDFLSRNTTTFYVHPNQLDRPFRYRPDPSFSWVLLAIASPVLLIQLWGLFRYSRYRRKTMRLQEATA